MMVIKQYDYLFKIVIIGNSSVGKSSILKRFADDQFPQSYLATVGVDFRFKSFSIGSDIVKFQIWDTAGQQRFRTITSAYYKGAHAIFVVYDISNQQSFLDMNNFWFDEVQKYAQNSTKVCILGNKQDSQKRKVQGERLWLLAKQKKCMAYQVSAKTGKNVLTAFLNMAKQLIKIHPRILKTEQLLNRNQKKTIPEFKIKSGNEKIEKSSDCC